MTRLMPAPRRTTDPGSGPSLGPGTEEREVAAADPALSPETNARMTVELREILGSARVRVPADRPHASRGERPGRQQGAIGYLSMHRFQLFGSLLIALTFGAIISLITNDWWLLPLAAGVHALGTMSVTMTIIHMTTIVEHPSPELAAALAEDGVSSPDERFSAIVKEFLPDGADGAPQVLSTGHNARTTEATADPALATAEQSTAMTPTAEPSRPGGVGGAPDVMVWVVALALLTVSIVFPAVYGGGWMWLTTAVMVPLLAGWVTLQGLMTNRGDREGIQIRTGLPLAGIVLLAAISVAIFCAVVAIAYT